MIGFLIIAIMLLLLFTWKEYKIHDWTSFQEARQYVVSRRRGTYRIFKFNGKWRTLRLTWGPRHYVS